MLVEKKLQFPSEADQTDVNAIYNALDRAQALIEFNLDGSIITANNNFLKAIGYTLAELQGKHHRMFCDPTYANSSEYKEFWRRLGRGDLEAGEFMRIGKGGRQIWINASYTPVLDSSGKPVKIIKFATDITEAKLKNANYEGQINAIGKSQAVIEFNLDGTIIGANENFLQAMGYTLGEIQGKHHRMFCEPAYVASAEYRAFWEKLGRGEFDAGEYKRIGSGGKEIYISASYNPILGPDGKPFKVIKYASDVSKQKLKDQELAALSRTQAVINFNIDGTILDANENFLKAMGYGLGEIKGKHHSMFCDGAYTSKPEYREFWAELKAGQFKSGQFHRVAKGGRDIWIQASYNPVFDLSGKVFKVVKYATDITKEKKRKNGSNL